MSESVKDKIIIGAISVYAGLFIKDFFSAITRDLVFPLLVPSSKIHDGVTHIQFHVFGVKLNIGDVIDNGINLIIALAIVYFMYPLLHNYVPMVGRR